MRRPRPDHRRRLRGLREQGREHRRSHLRRSRTRTSARSRYDCAAANKALDKLGYKRGSDGIRVVPATTGKYAQPAHPMTVRDRHADLDRLQHRPRVRRSSRTGFAKLGVKVTQKVGGDTTATYAIETGDCSGPTSKQYTGFDIAMWDWVGYVDPDFMLSVVTKAAVVLVERHRREQPRLRQALRPAGHDGRPGEAHGRSSTGCRRSSTTTSTTRSS